MSEINLDYSSNTPLLPEVRQAMIAALDGAGAAVVACEREDPHRAEGPASKTLPRQAPTDHLANPSSLHAGGRGARQKLEQARKQVAALINAKPAEISFTSCGTESNNWAIKGLLAANKRKGSHLIISSIEHPSVLLAAKRIERDGGDVTYLPATSAGIVEPETLKAALKPTTALVSIMHANGEVGTIEPITELARVAHEAGALFHTDAIASVGHIPVDVRALGVDALSLAANQFYGPAGAAALYVRDGVRILPLLEGGGQETGARSGTENLVGIVGMGAATELAKRQMSERVAHVSRLRDRLKAGLTERLEDIRFNGAFGSVGRHLAEAGISRASPAMAEVPAEADGSWTSRLPQNLHLCVQGVSSESLVLGLDEAGIAVGIGSACNSKAMRPSHVLKAIGLSDAETQGAILLSIGMQTTDEEIERALEIIPTIVARLRRVTAPTLVQ